MNKSMLKFFGMCMNWKVLILLVAVGGGLSFFLSPAQAWAVAPFLLFALCPLSMMFAMRGIHKGHNGGKGCVSCEQNQSSHTHAEKQ